jgi:hypothetical protein
MKNIKIFTQTTTVSLLSVVLLTACGGNHEDPAPTTSVVATAALGAVTGATCIANEIGTNRVYSAVSSTNADGKVVIEGLPVSAGAMLIDCHGGSYFDEATGQTKSLLATDVISTVLPKGATQVGVTPLTSLVAASIRQVLATAPAGSTISNAQLTAVSTSIASVFAPGIDLLAPPKVIKNAADVAAIAGNDPANQYAAALAGLSALAKAQGFDQTTLMQALVADVADGVIGDDLTTVGITDYADLSSGLDTAAAAIVPNVDVDVRATEDQAVVTPPVVTPPVSGGSGSGG